MRVLHLISSGGLYGAEAVILQLCQVLHREQPGAGQIGVFAHAGQPSPALFTAARAAGLPAHLLPCRGQIDLSVGRRIRDLAQQTGADVIHAHGYKADIYTFLSLRGRERPALVSTCHTWYDNDLAVRLYGAADRWVLRSFDEVVAVSAAVQRRLLAAGVSANRVALVRNGVQTGDPSPEPPQSPAAEVGFPRVGLVGRLAPEKGIDIFVRAAALLVSQWPEVVFTVAGEGPDRAALESLRAQLGLQQQLQFCGQQQDMQSFYRSLDLLVSASRQEGLPMALLEGMSLGLPVVATTVGEVPQVVVDEETGLLVPPEDPDKLAAAMGRLLAEPSLRRAFGMAGQRRVATEFSAQRMTDSYCEVYGRALSRRSQVSAPVPSREVR